MTDRELLKEAREFIVAMVDWNKAMLKIVGHIPDTGFQSAEGLLSRIDEHLADHSPDAGNMVAMELVQKIRETTWLPDSKYDPRPVVRPKLTDNEAAALIEQYGRRVPRAMLEEIERKACRNGDIGGCSCLSLNKIASKYGVKIEEEGE